jgi:hypothetical protein
MADKNFAIYDNGQALVLGKLEQQDDGTYAKVVKNVGPSGSGKIVAVTPGISTTAYSIGDNVGGKITLASSVRTVGNLALLVSLLVVDKSNIKPALELLFFNADPTAATLTDNAAISLSTDVSKICGRLSVASTDYVTVGGVAVANLSSVMKLMQADMSTVNLYAAAMAPAAITFAGNSDLILTFGFDRY